MKNIHVLPTEKPSRLHFTEFEEELVFTPQYEKIDGVNIYITNSEEIKEGDWFYNSFLNEISKMDILDYSNFRQKIILTTDADLIKDGVQAIKDEFLEWFVKNPSCEEVEIEESYSMSQSTYSGIEYEIITTKEELSTKLHIGEVVDESYPKEFKQQCKDCNDNLTDCTCIEDTVDMKQETLEERRAQAYIDFAKSNKDVEMYSFAGGFNSGYKLAQEEMYSKEDMMKAVKFGELYRSEGSKSLFEKKGTTPSEVLNRWFEQIKKK